MEQIVAILAWPAVVLIVALVAIFVFRTQLAALIGRTKRLGKGGLETFDVQPPQSTEEKKGVDEFFRTFDNPMVIEAEGLILKDLKDRKIEAVPDRERTLIRALAVSNIIQHFERVHGIIWASQLACLQYLNARDDGVDIAELQPLYEAAKAEYPAWYENQPFERWLGFLRVFNLILERDSRVFITVAGREFLKYLVAAGKSGPYHG